MNASVHEVLLSWLQRVRARSTDDPDAARRRAAATSASPVEDDRPHRARASTASSWPGSLALRAHPDADKHPARRRRRRRRRAAPDLLRRVQHGRRRPRAARHRSARSMPGGMEIGRRKMRGEWSNGMLCSTPRARARRRPRGHPASCRRSADPARRCAEALGIVRDVLYDLEINPNRPDAMCVAGVARDLRRRAWACRSRCPTRRSRRRWHAGGARRPVEIVDARPAAGGSTRGCSRGVAVGTVAELDRTRLTRAGMRPINNVVDVSNYVMLELGQPNHPYDLGQARRRRASACGGRRDGETLDDARRRRAHAHRATTCSICDARATPDRHRRDHGRRVAPRSADTTTDVLLEMAWFQPIGDRAARRSGSACAPRRRPGSSRAATRRSSTLAAARFVELLARHLRRARPRAGRGRRARRAARRAAGARCAPARVNALLGTDLDGRPDRAAARPDRVRLPGGRRRPRRHRARRGGYDSTAEIDVIEEVARHYGYDRIARRCRRRRGPGRLTATQQSRRRASARCCSGLGPRRGDADAVPGPRRSRPRRARAETASRSRNPLVAEESVLRTSLRPGLLGRSRYNESHRSDGVRLFEIGHVFLPAARAGQRCPTSASTSRCCWPGGRRPPRSQVWHVLAELLRRARRPRVTNAALPGLHPTRSARTRGRRRRRSVRSARSTRVSSTAYGIGERVAWLEVDLGRAARPAASRPSGPAGQPLPVERHRPRLRGTRRGARDRTSSGPSPARPTRSCGRWSCSTSSGAASSARAGAASPIACACRPTTAPSPTRRWPRPAPLWSPPPSPSTA